MIPNQRRATLPHKCELAWQAASKQRRLDALRRSKMFIKALLSPKRTLVLARTDFIIDDRFSTDRLVLNTVDRAKAQSGMWVTACFFAAEIPIDYNALQYIVQALGSTLADDIDIPMAFPEKTPRRSGV
jgi:hypothetical protein